MSGSKNITVSIDSDSIGLPLHTEYNEKGLVNNIVLELNGKTVNFLYSIINKTKYLFQSHKDKNIVLDKTFLFYKVKISNTNHILAIKNINDKEVTKLRYSTDGTLVISVVDTLSDNLVCRKQNNDLVFIHDGEVVYHNKAILLKNIPVSKKKNRTKAYIKS